MRTVALGSTFYFTFASRAYATGIPTIMAGTPDLSVIELDSSFTVNDASATWSAHATITQLNQGTVVATAANGFEAGKTYSVVIDTGTVASVSAVGEQVYEFRIETAAELAAREYAEAMFPGHVLGTQTGVSDGTAVNLTGILDSSATADDINNEILAIRYVGGTYDGLVVLAQVTDYAVTNQLATIRQLDTTALPETLASGDMCWRVGQYTATADVTRVGGVAANATNLASACSNYSATRGLTGTALPAAAAEAAGGLFTRGTGAGQINQANNGEIDVDVNRINGAVVVGDGNATPWDGA